MNHSSTSQSSSDAAIRRFLLCDLQVGERTLVEQRLFEDEEFEARVRLEELAMADDYARQRLSAADNERFRARFLVTEDRYRALAVSRALQTKLSAAVPPVKTETSKLRNWFDFSQPVWRYAFGVLLLLLVFATVRRVVNEPSLVRKIIPTRILPKTKPMAQQPDEANHPAAVPAPSHAAAEPTLPPHELIALTLTLDSNSTAEHPSMVPPTAAANIIRMRLMLPKNQTGPFHVELLTTKGEAVLNADSPGAGDGVSLNFDVPAGLLKAGDYQISVTSAGKEPREAEAYYFRVH